MTAREMVLLPEPDSPTKPKASPSRMEKETLRTAGSIPRGVEYTTLKSSMLRTTLLDISMFRSVRRAVPGDRAACVIHHRGY